MTSCIECQLDMHAPREAVPLCTLATIPRQPQHCIEWAHIIAWDEERKGNRAFESPVYMLNYGRHHSRHRRPRTHYLAF